MLPLNTPPSLIPANNELQRIVNANPLTLTDMELQILLSLGANVVTINDQLVPVGPQTPKWVSWKVEHDSRLMNKQIKFIKYSTLAAGITALAALVTTVITLIQVIRTNH